MSWNKNTRSESQITSGLGRSKLNALPYALVRGNGLNDFGANCQYVLCYALDEDKVYFDQMVRSGDCDFDDVVMTTYSLQIKDTLVIHDFTADAADYGGKERLKPVRLKPLPSMYVVKNTARPHAKAKFLHQDIESAQAEAARLSAKLNLKSFRVIEVTPEMLAANTVASRFLGV